MGIRLLRGSTTKNDSKRGGSGLLTVDTDKNNLRVHDGSTKGGFEIPNKSQIKDLARGAVGILSGSYGKSRDASEVLMFAYRLDENPHPSYGHEDNIIFNTITDSSPHWNSSTGTFTAPVKGVYHFDTQVFRSEDGVKEETAIWLSKNGNTFGASPYSTAVSGDAPKRVVLSIHATMNLEKGDTIEVKTTGLTADGGRFTYISGYLI